MSLPTRMLAGRLGRLRRRLAATVGRRPRRTDGGAIATAGNDERRDDADHLQDVPDGAGCAEIWEHLSDGREEETDNGSE